MNRKTGIRTAGIVLILAIAAAGATVLAAQPSRAGPPQENPTGTPTPAADVAAPAALPPPNPASFYCGKQGGDEEIILGPDGAPVGICHLPDGSQCEEWAFLRGECIPPTLTPTPTSTPAPTVTPAPRQANMTNPASTYCARKGGRVKIVTNRDGSQTGLCLFRNGSQCEEWAYYYGKCNPAKPTPAPTQQAKIPNMRNPASVYCEKQGGKVQMMTMMDGGEVGLCVFPDGSQCEEWAYYNGECVP